MEVSLVPPSQQLPCFGTAIATKGAAVLGLIITSDEAAGGSRAESGVGI